MNITYLEGDATSPIGEGDKVLVHCCNDIGVMGAGIARIIAKKWPLVLSAYQKWLQNLGNPQGRVLYVRVSPDIVVANIIGQRGVGIDEEGNPPIRYDSLRTGLESVEKFCSLLDRVSIHMPRIGCGLAGGSWSKIEPILEETVTYPIFVYDYGPFNP